MGTIYECHTDLPLSKLGLDRCRVRKLTLNLNTHSIQWIKTRPYTAMPQSKPTYHPDWSDGNHL